MRYLKSKNGEIQTEQYWREWTDNCWKELEFESYRKYTNSPKKPKDAFERIVKLLGLEEIIIE